MNRLIAGMIVTVLILGISDYGRAGVIVSTGYNDDPNEDPLPNPWVNSPNTIVVGNSSQISAANSFDPDMNAVLFQNTGASSVVLSSLTFEPSGIDLFAIAGQSTPVTIAAGQNLIVLGVDGSDEIGSLQTVNFTLDGKAYSVTDATTADAFDGVLHGKVNWTSSETQPWAQIFAPATSVPVPSTFVVSSIMLGMFGLARARRQMRRR